MDIVSILDIILSAYAFVAIMCFWACFKSEKRVFYTWIAMGLILFTLRLFDFFNVQELLHSNIRNIIKTNGIYDYHREMQAFTLGGIFAVGILISLYFLILLRRHLTSLIAYIGIATLIGIFISRILSYHHLDKLINLKFIGISLAGACEIMAIIIITSSSVIKIYGPSNALPFRKGETHES